MKKNQPNSLKRYTSFYRLISRLFNLLLATVLSVVFFVPFLFICLLVKLTSRGPIIHWSKRVGVNNSLFLMPKFRTMKIDTPQVATHLLADGQSYLTPIGGFLRKTSLDELPQLWSVLAGDMSFVGPRPALFNQDDLVELRTNSNIHLLRPGITGWAQINGRDEISIEQKVSLERDYLDHMSFGFDLKILILTFVNVLLKKNIKH